MKDIVIANKKTYDALAAEYEQKTKTRKSFNHKIIERFAKNITKAGGDVLDIGCAVGLDIAEFASLGFKVTGIELSDKMARFAQKRNPGTTIIVGDFMQVQFSHQFDAIFAQAFIHLYPKDEASKVFAKIYTLLNKDGVAHLTTSAATESKEGWYEKKDYAGKYKRYRKFWTCKELEAALLQAGFGIIDYYEISDPYDKRWMVFAAKK